MFFDYCIKSPKGRFSSPRWLVVALLDLGGRAEALIAHFNPFYVGLQGPFRCQTAISTILAIFPLVELPDRKTS